MPFHKKQLLLIISALIVVSPVLASFTSGSWSVINNCPSTPFCVKSGDQPAIQSGEFFPSDSLTQQWTINGTGSSGAYDIRVLANSSNSNVADATSGSQQVEIHSKDGIIPNTETTGFPFFVQSGDSNPASTTGDFKTTDSLNYNGDINATGAAGNYTVFFFANSTNSNVGRAESGKQNVEIILLQVDQVFTRNLSVNSESEVKIGETERNYSRNILVEGISSQLLDRDAIYNRDGKVNSESNIELLISPIKNRFLQVNSESNIVFNQNRDLIRQLTANSESNIALIRDADYDRLDSINTETNIGFDRDATFNRDFLLNSVSNIGIQFSSRFDKTLTVTTESNIGFDRQVSYTRPIGLNSISNIVLDRNQTVERILNTRSESNIGFDRDATYNRNLLTQMVSLITFDESVSPRINNVTLKVDNLGSDNNVTLDINATDEDGQSNIDEIRYNGETKQATGQTVFNLDIGTDLSQQGTIVAEDNQGLTGTYTLNFTVTDNPYKGTGSNLSTQSINKTDDITADSLDSGETLYYDITHETFSGTEDQGGTFNSKLTDGQTDNLFTNATGDFLIENRTWTQDDDFQSTVEKQYIEEEIEITNQPDISWTDITVPKGEAPQGYGNTCDSCAAKNISFSDNYFNSSFNQDTGDAIDESFDKTISDVEIGERDTYFEQYSYIYNTDVELDNIEADHTINDSEFNFGAFIKASRGNDVFGSDTLKVSQTISCDTDSPDFTEGELLGQTWKGCAEDNNGNSKADYFKTRLRNVTDNIYVRYGGFTGVPPEEGVKPFQGLTPCSPEGAEVTAQENDLVCYKNQWRLERNIDRPTSDASLSATQLTEALGFLIFIFGVVGTLVYRNTYGELPSIISRPYNRVNRLLRRR